MLTAFRPPPRVLLCLLALGGAACSDRVPAPPPAPAPLTDPVAAGTPLRFTGEVILTGALARETSGALVLSVRPIGGTEAIWQRSYELGDPWWLQRGDTRSLPFGLSSRDALVEPQAQLSVEMELVARFDPDGNPATDEADAVEVVTRARTGATDLIVTLERPRATDESKLAGQPERER